MHHFKFNILKKAETSEAPWAGVFLLVGALSILSFCVSYQLGELIGPYLCR